MFKRRTVMMTTSVVMAAALGTASAVLKFKADLDADSVAYGCKGGNSIDKILFPSFGPSLCLSSFFEKGACINCHFPDFL